MYKCSSPEAEGMDVLLQRLVETAADDVEQIVEDGDAKVTLLHVRDGGELPPRPR